MSTQYCSTLNSNIMILLFIPSTTIDANVFQYRLDNSPFKGTWNITSGAYEFKTNNINQLEDNLTQELAYDINGRFETLIGKTIKINQFLTSDPYNKRGEKGIVKNVEIFDEENADFEILFEDGTIGFYQFGTFDY